MPEAEHWIALARKKLDSLRASELEEAHVLPGGERFFPTITYPPQTMYPSAVPESVFDQDPGREGIPHAVYVHIPFCASRCSYCHWVKIIDPDQSVVDDYIETLARDMKNVVARLGKDQMPASTVLFGGGTPTLLTPAQMERLLTAFTNTYDLSDCRQFSYEAEPASICGPLGKERLRVLRDFGVDRISLGVQSYDDDVLRLMGRPHEATHIQESVDNIHAAGIDSICIDLIYGYPGLTEEAWIRCLETAIASGVDAWHLYRLRIIRHGDVQGPIMEQYKNQPDAFPSVDRIRLMKMLGVVLSEENGFNQHFTRIFARGQEHVTQFMWDYCCNVTNVMGNGPSAWANYHRTFTLNVGSDFTTYRKMVRDGRLPINRGMYRDEETDARRCLMLPLKNSKVIKAAFTERTGLDAAEHFGPELARLASMDLLAQDDDAIWLTDRGRFFADEVMMQLYQRRYVKFPEVAHDLMPD